MNPGTLFRIDIDSVYMIIRTGIILFLTLLILVSCGNVRDSSEVHSLAVEFLSAVKNGDAAAINRIMPGADVRETDLRDADIPVKDLIKSIKVEKVPGRKAFRVHLGAFNAVAEPGEDGSWILKPGEVRTRTIDIIPAE